MAEGVCAGNYLWAYVLINCTWWLCCWKVEYKRTFEKQHLICPLAKYYLRYALLLFFFWHAIQLAGGHGITSNFSVPTFPTNFCQIYYSAESDWLQFGKVLRKILPEKWGVFLHCISISQFICFSAVVFIWGVGFRVPLSHWESVWFQKMHIILIKIKINFETKEK